MSTRIAKIYCDNLFTGILKQTDEGFIFTYDLNYFNDKATRAISLTLLKNKIESGPISN